MSQPEEQGLGYYLTEAVDAPQAFSLEEAGVELEGLVEETKATIAAVLSAEDVSTVEGAQLVVDVFECVLARIAEFEVNMQLFQRFDLDKVSSSETDNHRQIAAALDALQSRCKALTLSLRRNKDVLKAIRTIKDELQKKKDLSSRQSVLLRALLRHEIEAHLAGADLANEAELKRLDVLYAKVVALVEAFRREQGMYLYGNIVHVSEEEAASGMLDGLPKEFLGAREKDEGGWHFHCAVDYENISKYAAHEGLRALVMNRLFTYSDGGAPGSDTQNALAELVQASVANFAKIAEVLGHDNWAEVANLRRSMESPEEAETFIVEFLKTMRPIVEARLKALEAYVADEHDDTLSPYNAAYYKAKRSEEKYGALKEAPSYFPAEPTIDKLLEEVSKSYGLDFEPRAGALNPECRLFTVKKNGEFLGVFELRRTAHQGNHTIRRLKNDLTDAAKERGFHAFVNLRAPLPNNSHAPDCLSLEQVLTFRHELGHAIQILALQFGIPSIADGVLYDEAEVPSTAHEILAVCFPEFLKRIASPHHASGAAMPDEMAKGLIHQYWNSQMEKYYNLAISALYDIRVHKDQALKACTSDEARMARIKAIYQEVVEEHRVSTPIEGDFYPAVASQFGKEEYAAGFYSYILGMIAAVNAATYCLDDSGDFDSKKLQSLADGVWSRAGFGSMRYLFDAVSALDLFDPKTFPRFVSQFNTLGAEQDSLLN